MRITYFKLETFSRYTFDIMRYNLANKIYNIMIDYLLQK